MHLIESCHLCKDLVKNYVGEERLRFNACCGRSLVSMNSFSRPRLIAENTGPMLQLTAPDWCPKKRGVTKEFVDVDRMPSLTPPPPPSETKPLTYFERKEKLMELPRRIKWEDIEEDGVYVIPKILNQSRKVVRIVIKGDSYLRCSEIDEHGNESQVLTSIYPKDIDAIFITKVLKF